MKLVTPGKYVKKDIFIPFLKIISLSSKPENTIFSRSHMELELKVVK